MRIAINLLPFRKYLGGSGVFAKNVVFNLARLDKKNEYFLFITPENISNFMVKQKNFKIILCHASHVQPVLRIMWEQIVLPFQLKYYKIDVLFTPSVAIPHVLPCKSITVIHDIAPFHNVKKYTLVRNFYVKYITKFAACRSDVIISVSKTTQNDMIKFFKIDSSKVFVLYNAVNDRFRKVSNKEEINDFKKRCNLPEEFILYVGAIEPGKNIEIILKAYHTLKTVYKIQQKFVLTGGLGWGKKNVYRIISQLNLSSDVVITPYISEHELPKLYNSARLFVYPSTYEGFGLPPLEAMSCGVPVIVSNSSSLPEVVGDAGIIVEPYNLQQWITAIYNVLTNESLRSSLSTKGIRRAKIFNWEDTARRILQLIEQY